MNLVSSANNISTDDDTTTLKFKKSTTTTTIPVEPPQVTIKNSEIPIKNPGKNKKNTSPYIRHPQTWIYPQNNPYQLYHPYHRLTVYRNKK